METEENRGLIHKKAYENQLVTFCQFSFGALSLFSLSLSLTLGHLEFSWSTLKLEQEMKIRQEEANIKQGKVGSSSYNRLHCRYQLACVYSLLDLACMGLHVVFSHHGMGFSRYESIFNLALSFLDSLDEMGSLIRFMWDGQIGFESE